MVVVTATAASTGCLCGCEQCFVGAHTHTHTDSRRTHIRNAETRTTHTHHTPHTPHSYTAHIHRTHTRTFHNPHRVVPYGHLEVREYRTTNKTFQTCLNVCAWSFRGVCCPVGRNQTRVCTCVRVSVGIARVTVCLLAMRLSLSCYGSQPNTV